jgi:dienelactone hydrolase
MGISDETKTKAAELAGLGYVAFVADIYGKGVRPADMKAAGELAGKYKADRPLLRKRALAAYETLKKNPRVTKNKIAAQGYCFGGTTVIEMALAGAPLTAVTTLHGGLEFPTLEKDVKNIKAKLLILHGAIDPYVPPAQVATFTKALDASKVDYQFVAYSGAVHSFSNPKAGNDIKVGAAYNPVAEKRAFQALKSFYAEVFN